MRTQFTSFIPLASLIVVGLVWAMSVTAAPTKQSANSTVKSRDEDPSVEIPAVPYLVLALARDPSVHAELGLKTAQVESVNAAIAQVDESFWQLRDVPVKDCATQLEMLHSKLVGNLRKQLTQSQSDRFDQIVLQGRSWKALVSPEMSDRLKLSSDQVARLKAALKDSLSERESTAKANAGKSASIQEQQNSRLKAADTRRFADILTVQQRTDYTNQLGQPFDFSRVKQIGCVAPELRHVTAWINSDPIALKNLRGKVVVVHFWAFSCINCIRNLPHYQSWHEKYGDKGVTVIGIQTPETASERQIDLLRRNVIERNIEYPVVFDAQSENWKAWGNNMWPSVYLIDKQGNVRNWWYGELNWDGARGEEFLRKRIEELLAEK